MISLRHGGKVRPWRVLVDDERVVVVLCKEQGGGPGLLT